MKAYEVIKKFGWQQGWWGNENEGFCTAGAILRAYSTFGSRNQAMDKLRGALQDSIVDWNDAEGRTKRQVLALLRKVDV